MPDESEEVNIIFINLLYLRIKKKEETLWRKMESISQNPGNNPAGWIPKANRWFAKENQWSGTTCRSGSAGAK